MVYAISFCILYINLCSFILAQFFAQQTTESNITIVSLEVNLKKGDNIKNKNKKPKVSMVLSLAVRGRSELDE
jgi:hypothetical protein